jgi:hypothetical protein
MDMRELLEEVSRHHFPNPPASVQDVEEFERREGWRLDPELRAFYLHCNGADLFQKPGSPYRFMPLSEVVRARIVMRGDDEEESGPASLYAICNVQDGNYVLIDVSKSERERYPIIDGFHETFPDPEYCQQIAGSFSEFLQGALRSEGYEYWLG